MSADPPIITLTTDFGHGSPYVAEIKGAILSINRRVCLVDVSHAVGARDIAHGALVLRQVSGQFPAGSIHVAVVDPGVGTERRILLATMDQHYYIAPDNGLLDLVARGAASVDLVALDQRAFWRNTVSPTFHGRDIMAPVAAHLSRGTSPTCMGSWTASLVPLDFPVPTVEPGSVRGVVVAIDSFGNLLTNITEQELGHIPARPSPRVLVGAGLPARYVATYGQALPGDCVSLLGSSGCLEVAIANGNAARVLELGIGCPVVVQWPPS